MNESQRLWLAQARSDIAMYQHLRKTGVHECHVLHYLQMATAKFSKAYLWRTGHAPPQSHVGLSRFLRALLDRRANELDPIARVLGFPRPDDLRSWVKKSLSLARELEGLAPALAGDGPNPEYPWPHDAPTHAPATHAFPFWKTLTTKGQGRKLLLVVERIAANFELLA